MGPGLRPETSTSDGILGPIQLPCSVGQLAVAATSVTGRALSSVSPRPTRASRLASATIPLRSGAGPLHPSLRPRVATTTVCRPRILAGPCITAILHRLRSPGFDRASGFYLAADQSRLASRPVLTILRPGPVSLDRSALHSSGVIDEALSGGAVGQCFSRRIDYPTGRCRDRGLSDGGERRSIDCIGGALEAVSSIAITGSKSIGATEAIGRERLSIRKEPVKEVPVAIREAVVRAIDVARVVRRPVVVWIVEERIVEWIVGVEVWIVVVPAIWPAENDRYAERRSVVVRRAAIAPGIVGRSVVARVVVRRIRRAVQDVVVQQVIIEIA